MNKPTLIDFCKELFQQLEHLPIDKRVETINEIRKSLHKYSPMKEHPIDLALWVPQTDVRKNDYNPNSVAPTELKLLETSISEDGYTQPVVTWISDTGREIIDGFHRSKVANEIRFEIAAIDKEIDRYAASYGMNRNDFFQILDLVSSETVNAVIPLLKKRIALFKRIWASLAADGDSNNVLLFSKFR